MTRIPITMCHGLTDPALERPQRITTESFKAFVRIADELGFRSISYDELEAWRAGSGDLPKRAMMWDFDHPVKSMRHEIHDALSERGYTGNLFVNTEYIEAPETGGDREMMTWDEVGELAEAGWQIGAHTHTHPNLSKLSEEDPSGEKIRVELETCDELIRQNLGLTPKDFAFTGTTFSTQAEQEVKKRYRFGRLWIVGAEYHVDGRTIRYADLVGVAGADEADGGPPNAARYITKETPAYRLPSMELARILNETDAFRAYLEGALG